MRLLKGCLSVIPLVAVAIGIGLPTESPLISYPAITWLSLGIIAALSFIGICWTNNDFHLGDIFPGIMIGSLGIFGAIMVGVIGLLSLGDPEKRAAYVADQVSREARSGIFD